MARKSTNKAETKTAAVKTAPVNPTAAKEEIKAAKTEAPAVKETPAKDVKAAVKETSAEKKPAAKKTAAAKKPAEKKSAVKKTAATAKNTTVKTTAKAPAKTAKAAKTTDAPAAKKGRKPKAITIEDICTKVAKKASKDKAGKITGTVAADIEIYGWENGDNKHMYIEIKDGSLTIAPFNYDEFTVRAAIPFTDAVAFIDGKLSLKDAVISGKMYAEGVIGDALKIVSLFE